MSDRNRLFMKRWGGSRWPVLVLILIVILSVGVSWFRGEPGRWRAAAQMETWLDGQHDEAIDGMQQLVERNPRDAQMRLVLVGWLLDQGHAAEALQLVESAPSGNDSELLVRYRIACLQATGQPEAALDEYRRQYPPETASPPENLVEHLNQLSYLQALAESDLPLARDNMHRVVNTAVSMWIEQTGMQADVRAQVAILSALAYRGATGVPGPGEFLRTRDHRETILALLTDEIEERERGLRRQAERERLRLQIPTKQASEKEKAGTAEADDGTLRYVPPTTEQSLAELLAVRALIWQDLDDLERSHADRRRIAELDADPEVLAAQWPELVVCGQQLARLSAYLDTRGCVLLKLAKSLPERRLLQGLREAGDDMELAITAQRALCESGEGALANRFFDLVDQREMAEARRVNWDRNLAVLLYHETWLMEQLGRNEAQRRQLRQIRNMGFEPGPALF